LSLAFRFVIFYTIPFFGAAAFVEWPLHENMPDYLSATQVQSKTALRWMCVVVGRARVESNSIRPATSRLPRKLLKQAHCITTINSILVYAGASYILVQTLMGKELSTAAHLMFVLSSPQVCNMKLFLLPPITEGLNASWSTRLITPIGFSDSNNPFHLIFKELPSPLGAFRYKNFISTLGITQTSFFVSHPSASRSWYLTIFISDVILSVTPILVVYTHYILIS
jgi:hypothetical protein